MSEQRESRFDPRQAQKALARAYLSANRLEEAVRLLSEIVQANPNDWESLLILGDLYLAAEETRLAALLYERALNLQPNDPEILRRLRLAQNEASSVPINDPTLPTHPEALNRLLQRLTGRTSGVREEDLHKAAALLQTILQCPEPARAVAENLEQIEALLPAFIELNARQARQEGHPELAAALENLLHNLEVLLPPSPESGVSVQGSTLASPATRNLLLLIPQNAPSQERGQIISEALQKGGYTVTCNGDISTKALEEYDAVLAVNPHTDSAVVANLALCAGAGLPVLVDLSCHVEQIPLRHPLYPILGLGDQEAARAYNASLWMANLITVPSEVQASAMEGLGRPVEVIPDGWSAHNPWWKKKPPARETINLGWVGSGSEVEDLASIRRIILRVLREFPQTRLVLIDNPEVYPLFSTLPPERCLYLPATTPEDFPYQLGLIDILLLPHRNIPYNLSLSDRLPVLAGVRGIPWVASPIPAYIEWSTGGFIASDLEEWHAYLRQLVLDAEIRRNLGRAGSAQATFRESQSLAGLWKRIVEVLLRSRHTVQHLSTISPPLASVEHHL